MYQNQAKLT